VVPHLRREQPAVIVHRGEGWSLVLGKSEFVLPTVADNSIDSLVTDPPAGIKFMGKAWDGDKGGRHQWIAWLTGILRECYRAMKPGAHGLVWALPRTSHWTATACEDAGFEIRDRINHLFGTGFPKSANASKAIDKRLGKKRPVIGKLASPAGTARVQTMGRPDGVGSGWQESPDATGPGSAEAAQWEGFGTALKPAAEDWILIRKPLEGTLAENLLRWGVGALAIDACRIACESRALRVQVASGTTRRALNAAEDGSLASSGQAAGETDKGRWPSNVILDESVVAEIDAQSGRVGSNGGDVAGAGLGYKGGGHGASRKVARDKGGASRFFYVAKPSTSERDAGLDGKNDGKNDHETVKSIALMRYLVRLVTPPGGVVLDAFAGSGTTLIAARMEGASIIGIEEERRHLDKAARRVRHWCPDPQRQVVLL